jgi:4-alpha-glucanotransferase
MRLSRGSGILLHISSLPGAFGCGDLGDPAFEFVDMLAESGQSYWQILPLTPAGAGNSPYSSDSAFAGNTVFISPERLLADGLLNTSDVCRPAGTDSVKADLDGSRGLKDRLAGVAFEHFRSSSFAEISAEFDQFAAENAWWLDDYALFCALKNSFGGRAWFEWPLPLRRREDEALDRARRQYAREIDKQKFSQFLFFRQWRSLKRYANANNIKFIGDIPIFVALDSADVWCNQHLFKLNPDGSPKVVSGVPPDHYSEDGQLWGNPIYDWRAMLDEGLSWWTARIAYELRRYDIVRLDHFIGFVRNWEVPFGQKSARQGEWVEVPGRLIFRSLAERLGDLPLIAEDLGAVTKEVEELRDEFEFPGMRILQFGFGGDAYDPNLPHNYPRNCVAYTGTHDNDTAVGWYGSLPRQVRRHLRSYLGYSGREINQAMVRCLLASVADTVIIPLQDILGFGSDGRMNHPGKPHNNWTWRVPGEMLVAGAFERLKDWCSLYGR